MKEVAKRILSALLVINILLVTGCSNQHQGQKESFDPATDYQYQYYQPDVMLGGRLGNITDCSSLPNRAFYSRFVYLVPKALVLINK
ncbi:MAG: hypothetical protein ACI4CX_08360 [Candidatus Weimeria sp.]